MESNWRYNCELYGRGGPRPGLFGDDFELDFLAQLITPINLGGGLIATHIAVKPGTVFGRRYALGDIIPVGTSGYFRELASNVRPPGSKFPFALFPVHPDS